jgi:pilus assembly protein CpaC
MSDGRVIFEWREYGVLLYVKATVDRLGLVSLNIEPEVTELDLDRGLRVGDYVVPAFTTRRVKTSVVIQDGQTIAIGGLFSTKVTKIVEKLPVLADLPIIGALFQSTSFQKGQTELIILITPEIVRAAGSTDPGSLIAPDMEDVPASLR